MGRRSVTWREWGRSAFEESSSTGRPVFLVVTDLWSEASSGAPAALGSDPALCALLNASFVPVLADSDRHPEVAQRYGVPRVPSACLLRADGGVFLSLSGLEPAALADTLKGVKRLGLSVQPGGSRGLGLHQVPFLPDDDRGLERGSESLEALREDLESRLDPEAGDFGEGAGPRVIAPLRFLLEHSRVTGDPAPARRAVQGLHALALSDLYDSAEGGFYWKRDGLGVRSAKRLSDNAEWLDLALAACTREEGRFAAVLARGVLRFLQARLRLPSGAFAAGHAEDAAYFALSPEQRRSVPPPATLGPIYADANAAAIRALCRAWQVLAERAYLDLGLDAYGFVRTHLLAPGGAMAHVYEGAPEDIGLLQDQVEWGFALLELYRSTLDNRFLASLRETAGNLIASFKNPAGAGFLNVRYPPAEEGVPSWPLLDPALNARTALLLTHASAQLEDPSLAAPVGPTLAALLRAAPEDPATLGLLGSALVATLYPVSFYEAVTDGSPEQRARVVERIQAFGEPFPLVLHRRPGAGEHMRVLPRLTAHCAQQKKEIPLA